MKYILVTGASGGMGREAVKLLRNKGFGVFALDKKPFEAEDGVIPVQADLTDEKSIETAYKKVSASCDSLYGIVHFAGIYTLNSLVEENRESFVKAFEVNLFSVYSVNRIFLPLLKKGSRIIITTSELASLDPLPFTGIYAITKGALDKYAYSLRMELQLLDIKVSVLRAGAVKTDMLGISTDALDRFCDETKLYSCNAKRFKDIVNRVEARSISPNKIARKVFAILSKREPGFAYAINRNPLLILLDILPCRFRFFIIKQILKK